MSAADRLARLHICVYVLISSKIPNMPLETAASLGLPSPRQSTLTATLALSRLHRAEASGTLSATVHGQARRRRWGSHAPFCQGLSTRTGENRLGCTYGTYVSVLLVLGRY